mgnify:CR=1 FL=1
MGYYIGVGGVVTFKNARVLKEVVESIPLERILTETDCPYLSPEPNRGKRNSSLNLNYVAEALSQIKGINKEELIAVTEENATQSKQMKLSSISARRRLFAVLLRLRALPKLK